MPPAAGALGPRFTWGVRVGTGLAQTEFVAVASDSPDVIAVAGEFQGTVDFDPGGSGRTLTSGHGKNAFVAEYDGKGRLRWVSGFIGPVTEATDLAIDSKRNRLVSGMFFGPADFDPGPGSLLLTAPGTSSDGFLVKLDPKGELRWARQMGIDGTWLSSVAAGTDDTIYVAGRGGFATALASLDPEEDFRWRFSLALESADTAVDSLGNLIVVGRFIGSPDFDPGPGVHTLTASLEDLFVLKLTPEGELIWAFRLGGDGQDGAASVAIGPGDEIVVGGTFESEVDFDPHPGSTWVLRSAGGSDGFVAIFSSEGVFRWAGNVGSRTDDSRPQVAVGRTGEIAAIGSFRLPADLDPDPGRLELTPQGGSDAFVLFLHPSGALAWAGLVGGLDRELGRAVTFLRDGSLVGAGSSASRIADLDPTPAEDIVAGAGFPGSYLFRVRP